MSARIVFDLDGTLIDSAPDIQGIANAVLTSRGADPITLSDTRSFIGEGISVFVAKVRAERGIPDSEHASIQEQVIALYDDAVTLTVAYPGVPETLETLAHSYRLGICTNKLYRPTISVLAHLGIERHFSTVWGGDNPLGRKPNPAALLQAFDALGHGACIYVGDSEVDAETAKRAGVPFFLYTEGYRKNPISAIPHQASFEEFESLPGLLQAFLSA